MNIELTEGRILQERFVLQRPLRAGAATHLWTAHDRQLDTPILLRLHPTVPPSDTVTRDAIARDARRHRQHRHAYAGRVCDLHEADGLLFESIEPHDGVLLAEVLEGSGPVPFRVVLERVRPLVAAILHMHEHGGEHGRIDADHVLVDPEGRWTLLPGDATMRARSDMMQLGDLLAATLTGGGPPAARSLNEMPDRLHAGRTLPALLDQLVGDMRNVDVAQRPGGMQDVLHRLDQIEEFVATPAPATPDAAPPPRPPTPAVERDTSTRSRFTASRVAWVTAPVLLIGGVVLFGPSLWAPEPGPPIVETTVETDPPVTDPDPKRTTPGTPSPEDAARLATEQAAADDALGRYLPARRSADEYGAATWAPDAYAKAAAIGAVADAAYLQKGYVTAAAKYDEASNAFTRIADSRTDALPRLLREGLEAIEAMDAVRATKALQAVRLIDPGNATAQAGLERAATLDEVRRLLTAGGKHETEGRLPLALIDYRAAVELDPRSERAQAAYQRVSTTFADQEFRDIMTRGMEAYERGDLDEARRHLLEAQRFRPDAPEIEPALALVTEAQRLQRIDRLRQEAATHETAERWQDAWNAYRRVLAIDASIQFAQEGKTRCETMIRLAKHTRHFLDDPDLLLDAGSRVDAVALVDELTRTANLGPGLQRAYAELAELVRLATTPMRVVLRSDGKTSVDVYRVKRFEPFESFELELLPGVYTVVGHRRGYKDVRLTLRLKPGAENTTVTVICTKSI